MKLHVFPGSPNCRKVLATAAHLNLELEIVNHDIKAGSNQSAEFLAINPNGKKNKMPIKYFILYFMSLKSFQNNISSPFKINNL